MFKKILIANRGEIASRIIRTCKQMNVQTVAIYSEADEGMAYTHLADEAYLIGKSQVNESYMNIEKIIHIAKQTNVDAIHPGYGFLSEHPEFARRIEEEHITYIGPSVKNLSDMAHKITAKQIMKDAGLPVVPGNLTPVESASEAVEIANEIGYPIMLKASAGGGGIGMQKVFDEAELVQAFENNSARALKFFGDGSMFVEKLIENAHHIEVQILADLYGNVVHLFERECSIQRRNQKVIEEAPSPFLSEQKRHEIGQASVNAIQKIGYQNVGTIEFVMDDKGQFYFLEMNTRIQVEHPVTEEITGIDIVKEQLHIAAGERLSFNQTNLHFKGHSIEARIYAEDPKTFFPSPGLITEYIISDGEGIRHELTAEKDRKVTPFYDPMIAKLIVTKDTREEAIHTMIHTLEDYTIEGIKTNIPMILTVLQSDMFQSGITTTDFVQTYYTK